MMTYVKLKTESLLLYILVLKPPESLVQLWDTSTHRSFNSPRSSKLRRRKATCTVLHWHFPEMKNKVWAALSFYAIIPWTISEKTNSAFYMYELTKWNHLLTELPARSVLAWPFWSVNGKIICYKFWTQTFCHSARKNNYRQRLQRPSKITYSDLCSKNNRGK